MKEIKFRAWDEDQNQMLYGGFEEMNDQGQNLWHAYLDSYGELQGGYFDEDKEWHELKFLQFTGWQDMNNKDIYDKDIVRFRANYTNKPGGWQKGVIDLDKHGLHIKSNGHYYNIIDELDESPEVSIEILGNQYENPELLTQP